MILQVNNWKIKSTNLEDDKEEMVRKFSNKMNEMITSTDRCNSANDIKLNEKHREINNIKLKYSKIIAKVIKLAVI